MKYYKVKVKREPLKGGGTHYVYPEGFKELRYFRITYESAGDPETVEKRKDMAYEFVLISTPDDEVVDIPDSEEVLEVAAKVLKDKWTPKVVEPIL